jgi:hypothetical protein
MLCKLSLKLDKICDNVYDLSKNLNFITLFNILKKISNMTETQSNPTLKGRFLNLEVDWIFI